MSSIEEFAPFDVTSSFDFTEVEDRTPSDDPILRTHKFKIDVPRMRLRTNTSEVERLLKDLRNQTQLVTALWPQQFAELRRLEAEMKVLEQNVLKSEMEIMKMKRTPWCYICQKEAKYLGNRTRKFYCSKTCEKQHTVVVQKTSLKEIMAIN